MPRGAMWDDALERQLLLIVVHLTNAPNPDWNQVAAMMGGELTGNAVRLHLQGMLRDFKKKVGKPDTAGPETPRKGTPGKAKASDGESPSKSTGKRKVKKQLEDDDDMDESPTKKRAIKTECKVEDVSE